MAPSRIAYELGSRFWRQRIGSTAVRAMLEELAQRYGVRTVSATVKACNDRSLAFLQSLDFGADPSPTFYRASRAG